MKTDKQLFADFLSNELHFIQWHERKDGNDKILSKDFKRHKNNYILFARFDKNGDYIGGCLLDKNGKTIVSGAGFSLDFLLQLTREELKTA